MKAVVLEIKDGMAAVLREDGTVEKIKRDCVVGQTIELPERKPAPVRRTLRAAIAAVVVLAMLGGGWSYQTVLAYSYVSLDIAETSLEYTLNRRDQVLRVEARNQASQELARQVDGMVRRKDLTEALRQTVEIMDGGQEEVSALVAVTSGSETRAEELRQQASKELETEQYEDVEARTATAEERQAAAEQGVSTGRYQETRRTGDTGSTSPSELRDETGGGNAGTPAGETAAPAATPAPEQTPPERPTQAAGSEPEAPTAGDDRPREGTDAPDAPTGTGQEAPEPEGDQNGAEPGGPQNDGRSPDGAGDAGPAGAPGS